ncbi:hypothetical protein C8R45DRAFT_1180566 [Mycena sanguinolenta]|nr:hypothetical protein C8R45DRAFT_1180566 [Mycena sanguinolenta]
MAALAQLTPGTVSHVLDERYYFEDGGVVFLCENKLYKLHKTRLTLKSEFFKDLFDVPQNIEAVVDSQDDHHPVNLNGSGIKDLDFRHLLLWPFIYKDKLPDPTPLQFFLTHLPTHADFSPAIQLKLSRQYSLDRWVEPAFRALMQRPLAEITVTDAEHIGVGTYYQLVQLKCKVADHKVALAFCPPDVNHSFSCLDRNLCSRIWESFWWGGYAKQLLHPDNKKSPTSIFLELDSTKGVLAEMNKLCLQNTLDTMWENNPFNEEQELAEEAYKDLCAWMNTL